MFPLVMKFDNIHNRALHLLRVVEAWQKSGKLSRIERDIALDDLRALYNEIADIEVDATQVSTSEAAIVATSVVAEATVPTEPSNSGESLEFDDDVLDIDALLGLTPSESTPSTLVAEPTPEPATVVVAEPTPEPAPVVVAEPTPEPAPVVVVEPTPEPAPEVVAPSMSDGKLFAEEDIPVGRRRERKIVSLYTASAVGATAAAASTTTAAAATTATSTVATTSAAVVEGATSVVTDAPKQVAKVVAPAEEQPKRLVDVLGGGKRVLADEAAKDETPTTPFNRITDLRKAIGINDKFLMIRDLFGGSADLYNTTIDRLNAFDDIDDCMIYIAENFSWNPDSAGAKLLVSLIERKLG